MAKYNPFRPGTIVGPGMVAGRLVELRGTEQALHQTKHGNSHHFLIHGERGIGKSSLLMNLQLVANGRIKTIAGEDFKFLTINIELEPSNTYTDIIQKIGNELRREVGNHRPATEIAKTAWDFLTRWEVAGVKYTDGRNEAKPNELLQELTHTIERTLSQFIGELDGVVILIDEADKAPLGANLGEFVKVFTERLTKRGCNQVCLGLAGLSTLLHTLRQGHESSVRIFEMFTLEPLLESERKQVVDMGLTEANDKNGVETSITEDAKQLISTMSEGYPHFLQQFAFCAFNEDSDNKIEIDDVVRGALNPEGGAVSQLGLKYFHELYFDQIGADEYRSVLRAMAEGFDNWITKAEIRKNVKIKESTLNNALNALKKRHIIVAKPGRSGTYRLPTRSFAVWIKAFAKAKDETQTATEPTDL